MRNLIGIVALSLLAAIAGCASDDTEPKQTTTTPNDNPFADIEQNLNFTGGSCTADATGAILAVTVPTSGVLFLTKRSVDSQITANGTACGLASKIKQINVTGSSSVAETVIVDYSNGTFATGAAATATTGIYLDLRGDSTGYDKVGVKGTMSTDNMVSGNTAQTNGDTHYWFRVNSDNYPDLNFVALSGGTGMGSNPVPTYIVYLNDGNDSYTGGLGQPVTIYGGNGNDTFHQTDSATNYETMYGGAGTDTVSYALRTTSVFVDVGDETNGVPTGDDGAGTSATTSTEFDGVADDIEIVTGGTSADTLTARTAGSTLNGGDGTDSLVGLAGNDTLNGGAGNDTIDGGAGNDTINGDADNDLLIGGLGDDILSGSTGDDIFDEGDATSTGADIFNGGTGIDTVDYGDRTTAVYVTMDGSAANDGEDSTTSTAGGEEADNVKADVENVIGSAYDDHIYGNSLGNVITGNAGDDVLDGGAGNDVFDMLAANDGDDTITGGSGVDLVDYTDRTNGMFIVLDGSTASYDLITTPTEADILGADIENAWGSNTAADNITGNALANELVGNTGADTLNGAGGDDVLDGLGLAASNEADILDGGAGDGDFCFGSTTTTSNCEF